jgi:aminoglycoside adenylyltransferase-like protein
VRHEALPCPARGLELVLYPLSAVRVARGDAAFDLNLNTGRAMRFRVDVAPVPGDDHWFAIDRSILARHGVTLLGPPAGQTFAPIPHGILVPLLLESLRRHARGDARADDAVLNGCRALRFALDDIWSTKTDAGRWAIEHGRHEALVRAALDARTGNGEVEPTAVERFVAGVSDEIEAAA